MGVSKSKGCLNLGGSLEEGSYYLGYSIRVEYFRKLVLEPL